VTRLQRLCAVVGDARHADGLSVFLGCPLHVFALKQVLKLYDVCEAQITAFDRIFLPDAAPVNVVYLLHQNRLD
jgi:hypothetical protein